MSREKVEFDIVGKDAGGSKVFRDVSAAADKAGDQVEGLAKDFRGLDAEIAATQASVRDLAQEIDRTGNRDLFKDLRRQQSELRKLNSVRALLPDGADMGGKLAEQVSVSFVQRLGPLLAQAPAAGMNPAALAIGAPLAAGAATLIATAAAGAIVGGVGVGGVIGGLKLAARDPGVKAAGAELGESVSEVLQRAAEPMTPAARTAIESLRHEVHELEPDLRRVFAAGADYVPILTGGLSDGVESILDGAVDAMESARPVMEAIAEGARDIGDAVGDGLSDLSEYADEGARALSVLLKMMEGTVRMGSELMQNASELYGVAEITGALMTGDLARGMSLIADRQRDAAGTSRELSGGLGDVERGARDAAREVRSVADQLVSLNGVQLNANEAEREFQRAIDDARESFDGKTRDLAGATEKGREYGAALDRIASSARTSAQAVYDQTGSVSAANAKIEEGRAALYRQARQYGRTDAQAREYVDSVLSIPKTWTTDVNLNAGDALRQARAMRSVIESLRDRNITIGVRWQTNGDLKVPGGTLTKQATGGPVDGPGPKGVDSELRLLAPGEHVWTAREVDAAGGHRAMMQLRSAVLNHSTPAAPAAAPMAGGSGGRSAGSDQALAAMIGRELRRALQSVPMVRADAARMADLYGRAAV